MKREEFYSKVSAALTKAIENKLLDAWFFNDFDCEWAGYDNCEINKILNALIPGNWRIIEVSGNFTNVGLGIFYEKEYNMYLDLACYDEEHEEYIDTFNLYDKCPFKFGKETLARISQTPQFMKRLVCKDNPKIYIVAPDENIREVGGNCWQVSGPQPITYSKCFWVLEDMPDYEKKINELEKKVSDAGWQYEHDHINDWCKPTEMGQL